VHPAGHPSGVKRMKSTGKEEKKKIDWLGSARGCTMNPKKKKQKKKKKKKRG